MSKGVNPEEITVETYAAFFGDWVGKLLGFSLRAMAQGQEKRGPEILEEVVAFAAEHARDSIPATMQMLGITEADLRQKPFETYQQVFDFEDRVLGCKKIEWIRESPDSLVEIARTCWMMGAVKQYPEICSYLIKAISTAIRDEMWPDLDMDKLEMVPLGNAPDYCKVRVRPKRSSQ
ncbi:MAG: hypothetical protein QUS33_04295 [Dehalococcoidia bacterium]|nr:hypothetical protein [Dehalococcoidia bacterium]